VAREPDVLKLLAGVHVLVVDPDPEARPLLEATLAYCGAFVTTAAAAREAIDAMARKPADVVIADVTLPHDDAYRLVAEIGGRVPVVALATARGDGPDRTLGAGFRAHFDKPVDPWELCRAVAGLARKA
jgi:CheY-like chemotaxis protein